MINVADFVGLLLKQRGDEYRFGHEVSLKDPDPDLFDCAELVQWGCAGLQIQPTMPDGSWLQARHCRSHNTMTPVARAVDTQGALLFKFLGNPFQGPRPATVHVAVSLGNGSTIEARGRRWGVGQFSAQGRGWTHAALIPGLRYERRTVAPAEPRPAWPGRYLTQPPTMAGDDVTAWQQQMKRRGWRIGVDGRYGDDSEKVCRQFQTDKRLTVDGIVGPETWRATWTAPITP
ncbi:peptidoglycan-binding protein [Micromonospora sp. IBHARD004]|uniref:peptidoglycan-binding protein n=1 Tax=Micromonospora sp. IBHARD004 TaxID=3457764 RepID=UPI004058D349